MNQFVNAINQPQVARTENGMKALDKTGSKLVDFFYNAGSARGRDITPTFVSAFQEDNTIAAKLMFWLRDVRGGAGERELFRQCLKWLSNDKPEIIRENIDLVPFYGRWDDLFVIEHPTVRKAALEFYATALQNGDGLAAKWAPRKGPVAVALRETMGLSPKTYRKLVVSASNTVEQLMCAKQWDKIEFGKLPSVASARYQKAFGRNAQEKYAKYIAALQKGEAKINASAIFPHDVIYSMRHGNRAVGIEQWKALPNFLGEQKVLALVDVSGSMDDHRFGNASALDIALALGLYVADKLSGPFKDTFLTFSTSPQLLHLKGDIGAKLDQMERSHWAMSTDLNAAFDAILSHAVRNNVPAGDMPESLLIMSDMQFNQCVRHDDSALQMIRRKYENAGYTMPRVVFWNLNSSFKNAPASQKEEGVALVSGFSPSILQHIFKATSFTPYDLMMDVVNSERYARVVV